MGIWDRLGNVIKSYINNDAEPILDGGRRRQNHRDEDYNAAYEELEDFLRGDKTDKNESENKNEKAAGNSKGGRPIPWELKEDFAELGLDQNATEAECKEAYKKLLKIHHPDRHHGDPEKLKKATEKTARINTAYDRLEKWFKLNQ